MKIARINLEYGKFENYELTRFPDGSIKYVNKFDFNPDLIVVKTSLESSEDIIALALIKDTLDRIYPKIEKMLKIKYMMYQQDDRLFNMNESFGLKTISKIITNQYWDNVVVYHPHSDKVEMMDNCTIEDNTSFIKSVLQEIPNSDKLVWIIPDSGAFKTQFKQIEKLNHKEFAIASKSRDHNNGEIVTYLDREDFKGADCIIFDDICLGGRTFLNIEAELQARNCGKVYLAVTHGVFNYGTDHLIRVFEKIYISDSRKRAGFDSNITIVDVNF